MCACVCTCCLCARVLHVSMCARVAMCVRVHACASCMHVLCVHVCTCVACLCLCVRASVQYGDSQALLHVPAGGLLPMSGRSSFQTDKEPAALSAWALGFSGGSGGPKAAGTHVNIFPPWPPKAEGNVPSEHLTLCHHLGHLKAGRCGG